MTIKEYADKYLSTRAKLTARVEFFMVVDELKTELEKYRWIPVSERLPEKLVKIEFSHWSDWVLVSGINTHGDKSADVCFYNYGANKWSSKYVHSITHWKPINLPK